MKTVRNNRRNFFLGIGLLILIAYSPSCMADGFWHKTGSFFVSVVMVPVNAIKGLFYRSERKVYEAKENAKDNVRETAKDIEQKTLAAKKNVHEMFEKVQNTITEAVDKTEAVFDRWHKKVDDAALKQEAVAAREKLLKDLVQAQNDLKWINQEVYVSKLIDSPSEKVFDQLNTPEYVDSVVKDSSIALSTKQVVVHEWIDTFKTELENEEKILNRIDHELVKLIKKAEKDNSNCRQFVPDTKEALKKNADLKSRMVKLHKVIEGVHVRMIRNLNK